MICSFVLKRHNCSDLGGLSTSRLAVFCGDEMPAKKRANAGNDSSLRNRDTGGEVLECLADQGVNGCDVTQCEVW